MSFDRPNTFRSPVVIGRGKNAVLVAVSTIILILILSAGEIYVRATTETLFLGNSRNLFSINRFKGSYGNTPGIVGISFGQIVFIDDDGFRASERSRKQLNGIKSENLILVLGDSVAFGPGVPEEETFVGLLRIIARTSIADRSGLRFPSRGSISSTVPRRSWATPTYFCATSKGAAPST
jgi:hypothetical protein